MSPGTGNALGVFGHHRTFYILGKYLQLSTAWLIKSFRLQHDAEEPIGFFIFNRDDRLLFIPDTAYVENRFEGITMIAVECNNISELVSKNVLNGNIPAVVAKRIRRNHMSLENLIAMLKANDLSRCRTIYLMHLSDGNSDERRMKEEIQRATGIPTYAVT